MPIALIKIIEGRSPEKKRRLIESVSRAMADSLELPIDGVRVLLDEYPADRWGRGGQQVSLTKANSTQTADELALATAKLLSN
jgi:4-oxalocrotonate tautomerase